MSQFASLDKTSLSSLAPRFRRVAALLQQGKHQEAAKECKAILERDPRDAEAYHLLGLAAAAAGAMEDAAENFRQAIVLDPNTPTYFFNLGNAYTRLKRHAEAAVMFHNALANAPEDPSCWFNLGNAEHAAGNNDAAHEAFTKAVRFRPDYVRAWLNLGNIRRELGRYQEAREALEQAVTLDPEGAGAINNLGNLLREMGLPREATELLSSLLKKHPEHYRAWNNYGSALRESGHLYEAIGAYRKAIALQPDHAQAHLNLAMALLAAGEHEEGWREYEWRWTAARENRGYVRDFREPLWTGQPIAGDTILLHAEQGLGDALQFVRYVTLVKVLGARTVVESPPELVRLFQRMPSIDEVVVRGAPLPPFKWQCPFMSLPYACGTRTKTIPADTPYLRADPDKIAEWQRYFTGETRPRVGLVWAGNPRRHDPVSHMIDRRRSLRLTQLEPVLTVPGIAFYSLQKGESQTELAATPGRVDDLGSRFADFDDTAAAISCLDLIITVDTSVAHVAGALGRPVWMLSRFDACWRWGDSGSTSAWYPTMTIFRQPHYGDWEQPIGAIADQLARNGIPRS